MPSSKTVGSLGERREHLLLKDSLSDKIAGNIDMIELTEVCLRWSYEYALKDLEYIPLLLRPQFVNEYFKLSIFTRIKKFAENDELRTKLMGFFNKESQTKAYNRSNKEWLERMLKYFQDKNELEKCGKIREMLNEF